MRSRRLNNIRHAVLGNAEGARSSCEDKVIRRAPLAISRSTVDSIGHKIILSLLPLKKWFKLVI